MSISIKLDRNDVSPDLRKKLGAARGPEVVWKAAGTQVVSLTKRAFREASLRQRTWAGKAGGGASNLIRKGVLLSSIRIVSSSAKGVTVGSDRKYAAIHQLGGVIRPVKAKALVFTINGRVVRVKKVTIPARPFFPFTPAGAVAPQHAAKIQGIVDKAMRLRLGMK